MAYLAVAAHGCAASTIPPFQTQDALGPCLSDPLNSVNNYAVLWLSMMKFMCYFISQHTDQLGLYQCPWFSLLLPWKVTCSSLSHVMRWFGVWFKPKQCSGLRSIGPAVQPLFSSADCLVPCLLGGEQDTEQRSSSFLCCRLGRLGGCGGMWGPQDRKSVV